MIQRLQRPGRVGAPALKRDSVALEKQAATPRARSVSTSSPVVDRAHGYLTPAGHMPYRGLGEYREEQTATLGHPPP